MKKLSFLFLFALLVSLSLGPALSEDPDGDIWYSYLYLRDEELDSRSLGVPRGAVYDVYAAPCPSG